MDPLFSGFAPPFPSRDELISQMHLLTSWKIGVVLS